METIILTPRLADAIAHAAVIGVYDAGEITIVLQGATEWIASPLLTIEELVAIIQVLGASTGANPYKTAELLDSFLTALTKDRIGSVMGLLGRLSLLQPLEIHKSFGCELGSTVAMLIKSKYKIQDYVNQITTNKAYE